MGRPKAPEESRHDVWFMEWRTLSSILHLAFESELSFQKKKFLVANPPSSPELIEQLKRLFDTFSLTRLFEMFSLKRLFDTFKLKRLFNTFKPLTFI